MQARRSFFAAVALLSLTTAVHAQQPVKVSGKYLQKPLAIDVPAMRGLNNVPVFFMAGEATIRGGGIYEGVRLTVSAMGDVHGEKTLLQGVSRGEKANGTYALRWSGHCVNGKADGNAVSMCGGDWQSLPGGTGTFAGVVASGTWKGTFTPEGNFDAEWDGMYTK